MSNDEQVKEHNMIGLILRTFPPFKGKFRLARVVMPGNLKNKRNLQLTGKHDIEYFLPNIKEAIGFELFVNGIYEKGLVKLLQKGIPLNGTFIDIGANIGAVSVPLARLRPDITIIAIEASPWIYEVLKKNISLNSIKNISAVNNAAYSESGKTLSIYAPAELFGKGSLSPVFTKEKEMVTTITIDDIKQQFKLGSIDFIKIDVEGYEKSVFEGMNNVLQDAKPRIIFEFVDWAEKNAGFESGDAQSFLIARNYRIKKLNSKFKEEGMTLNAAIKGGSANLMGSFNMIDE